MCVCVYTHAHTHTVGGQLRSSDGLRMQPGPASAPAKAAGGAKPPGSSAWAAGTFWGLAKGPADTPLIRSGNKGPQQITAAKFRRKMGR